MSFESQYATSYKSALINHNYTSVTDRRQSCHRRAIQHGCSA